MIRFVPWSEVGTITVSPGDNVVEVGAFELAEGADTLWVRMKNTGTPGPWPWSYGILSFKTEEGQPLGSVKAYNSFDGEVFRLGVGLTPSVRSGVLTFEPRGFNMAWIKQGNPWSLKFEAQSGQSGGQMTSYWNRDSVNGVLSPTSATDGIDIGQGDLTISKDGVLQANGSVTVTRASQNNYAFVCKYGGTEQIILRAGGDALKTGSLTWEPLGSERRIKRNIADFDADHCWNVCRDLSPHTFSYLSDPFGTAVSGYVVDEVASVAPELIVAGTLSDEHGNIRSYNHGKLVSMQAVALQSALRRIEELERLLKPAS